MENAIKVPLLPIHQKYRYTCGVAALQSILVYYNLYPYKQEDLINKLMADTEVGTEPVNIVKYAKKMKLKVKEYHEMTSQQLRGQLNKQHPVICLIQAWGSPENYISGSDGHYIVAVGYDEENFYFVDPILEGVFGYLPAEEFERRWYFNDENQKLKQYGIAIWQTGFQYTPRAEKIS